MATSGSSPARGIDSRDGGARKTQHHDELKIRYSPGQIWAIAGERLGWSRQRPARPMTVPVPRLRIRTSFLLFTKNLLNKAMEGKGLS
jgi:hypothetical protein